MGMELISRDWETVDLLRRRPTLYREALVPRKMTMLRRMIEVVVVGRSLPSDEAMSLRKRWSRTSVRCQTAGSTTSVQ